MTGIVKWFSKRKGYGYITGTDHKDYYVHYSDIQEEGFRFLNKGEQVRFDGTTEEKGDRAINVSRCSSNEQDWDEAWDDCIGNNLSEDNQEQTRQLAEAQAAILGSDEGFTEPLSDEEFAERIQG